MGPELLIDVMCSMGVVQVQRASLCDVDDNIITSALSLPKSRAH